MADESAFGVDKAAEKAAKAEPAEKPQGQHVSDDAPEPDHDLLLSDGRVVESRGAIPTHYAEGDRVWRVVHVTERQSS